MSDFLWIIFLCLSFTFIITLIYRNAKSAKRLKRKTELYLRFNRHLPGPSNEIEKFICDFIENEFFDKSATGKVKPSMPLMNLYALSCKHFDNYEIETLFEELEKQFSVKIIDNELAINPTIHDLSDYIQKEITRKV